VSSFLTLLVLSHGAYPLAYQLLERPQQPTQLVAGTTFGALLSSDDGQDWKWVCEEAIGYGQSLNPVWLAAGPRLFAGSFRGLFVTSDDGCSWASHPAFDELPDGGQGTGVSDLHDNGTALFAVSGKYGVVNGAWRSTNGGVDWAPLPLADPAQFFTTVRSAPSRPQRLYVGAWWFRPSPTEAMYWSDDNGDSFTRVDLSGKMPPVPISDGGMAPARGSFYVYAVHPTDPDTIWAGLQQDDDPRHSFVLWSRDRGETWALLLDTADQLGGIAVSENASTVWAATSGKLYHSDDSAPFTPFTVPTRQSCISRYGARVYTCGWPEFDGFAVARDTGQGFEPLLTWPRISGVAACPPASKVNTLCAGYFPVLVASFPRPFDPDGGGGGAGGGGSGAGGGGQPPTPGCHCSPGGAELSLTLLLALGRFARGNAHRRRRVHR
jgi:hypothetical protein